MTIGRSLGRPIGRSLGRSIRQTTGAGVPTSGLISHWTMDNVSGSTLIDEQGNFNGTIVGATQVNDYLEFDGAGDYVDLGVLGLDDATITFWVYLDSIPSGAEQFPILSNWVGGSTSAYMTDVFDGSLRWLTYSGTELYSRTFSPSALNWYFISIYSVEGEMGMTWNTTTLPSTTSINDLRNPANNVLLGKKADSETLWLDGRLRHMRIYNRKLTGVENNSLYNGGIPI